MILVLHAALSTVVHMDAKYSVRLSGSAEGGGLYMQSGKPYLEGARLALDADVVLGDPRCLPHELPTGDYSSD